jgi:hypothetical protein
MEQVTDQFRSRPFRLSWLREPIVAGCFRRDEVERYAEFELKADVLSRSPSTDVQSLLASLGEPDTNKVS